MHGEIQPILSPGNPNDLERPDKKKYHFPIYAPTGSSEWDLEFKIYTSHQKK